MSVTTLRDARSSIASAASARAGGRSPDLALYAIDGANGALGPAFDAHCMPIKYWAIAHWEAWFNPCDYDVAVSGARKRLNAAVGSAWNAVIGPVTSLLLNLTRIG